MKSFGDGTVSVTTWEEYRCVQAYLEEVIMRTRDVRDWFRVIDVTTDLMREMEAAMPASELTQAARDAAEARMYVSRGGDIGV